MCSPIGGMPADWQKTRVATQAFQFPNSGTMLGISGKNQKALSQ